MIVASTSKETSPCTKCGRDRKHKARGMCDSCYHMWRKDTLPWVHEYYNEQNRKTLKRRYDRDPEYRRSQNLARSYPRGMAKLLAKLNLPSRRKALELRGLR